MALKAGYIGIKKSMLGLINSLASAKLIKSFGDGLNLTSAGKLNITAATASKIGGVKIGEGLEINGQGVLNCTVTGGFDYSSNEFDTGQKWIDGRTIYGKTFHIDTPTNNGELMQLAAGDLIIKVEGAFDFSSGTSVTRRALPMYYSDALTFAVQEDMVTYKVYTYISATNRASNMDVTIFYVKAPETPAE